VGLTLEPAEPEERPHTDLAEGDEGWIPPAPELHPVAQLVVVLASVALLMGALLAAAWLLTRLFR